MEINLKTTSEECDKCLLEINNQNHCCSCWQQWNNNECHCDKCHKTLLLSQFNHCNICCLLNNNPHHYHCCKCKKYYKKMFAHCDKCHFEFNKNDKHCCKCKISYTENEYHCCKCQITFDATKFHCCGCNSIYDEGTKHCCKCKILYTKNEYHCCKCQITCDVTKFHCCGCKSIYDEDNNHCCSCKIIYAQNSLHCCKCKLEYDKLLNHCSVCHLNYKFNEDHCCECSAIYNMDDYHCKLCHYLSATNVTLHCCKCITSKKICDGYCEVNDLKLLFNKLHEFIRTDSIEYDDDNDDVSEFYNRKYKNNYEFDPSRFIVSQCLKTKCNAYVKFIKTIKQHGYRDLFDLLNDDSCYKFVLHGTSIISAAQNICCNGFNEALRGKNGQAHGKGEYFTDKYSTGQKYSRSNGCVVVSLMVYKKEFVKCIDKGGEKWYVVNNTTNKSFILPIGIMIMNTPVVNYNDCPKNILNEFEMSNEITVEYYVNGGKVEYDEELEKIILENIKKKIYVFEIKRSDRKYKYNIDLLAMTQTNTSTNTVRGLLINHKN